MHGKSTRKMAKGNRSTPVQPQQRSEKWPHVNGSVVSRGSQHGQGMADTNEPSTGKRQCQSHTTANVESVRSIGGCDSGLQEESCAKKPVVSVGDPESIRRQSIHPQEQTDMVTVARPIGNVSTENVLRLLEYQQYRCSLTGRELTPDSSALDHIVPIGCGGEHAIENTQVLHKDVNRAKGSMTNDEFIKLCRGVARWNATRKNQKESK